MENEKFVGFGKRLVAYIVDAIIVYVIAQILIVIEVTVLPKIMDGQSFATAAIALSWIIIMLTYLAYFIFLESSQKQATLGKRIMKIKVVDSQGKRLSLANSIGRNLGRILSGMIMGIGYLMIIFTKKKQSLHDMLAKTYVVAR